MPSIPARLASFLGFDLPVESPWADTSGFVQADLAAMFGWADGHVRVSRRRAMQIATIASGRNTIAGTGGRLSLNSQRGGVNITPQPSFLQQFERGVPMSTTLTWIFDDLIFHPCTWLVVTERNFMGWPMWGKWVPYENARTDNAGNLLGYGETDVKPENVIRFDSPLGSGLLIDAARTIRRAIAIELAAALAEDNPVPTIELHNEGDKLDKQEREDLLEQWTSARRKRGVAYTSKGITAKEHGQNPAQLLIEGRRALSLDLVRHLNIPAWAASTAVEGGDLTYDNRSLRNWELIDLTLAPYFAAIAGRLSMPDVTPYGQTVIFNTDQLTTPDQLTRFQAYAQGKKFSFVDNAQIANWEGWESVPEDKYVPKAVSGGSNE